MTMLNQIITPILETFPSESPNRTGFKVINPENNQVLISGYCAQDNLPTFPEECLRDALTNPYHTIKKQFISLPSS